MSAADSNPQRRASAFTLVELLVVIGIIAVLIGVLVPTLSGAREQAKRAVCANDLRQLATACVIYLGQHRHYPVLAPLPPGTAVIPSGIDAELMNEIGDALRLPPVNSMMTVAQLPAIFHGPQRDEVDLLMNADASFGTPVWNTGFNYHGSAETPGNTGVSMIERRSPDTRGRRRGVLWSDHLAYLDAGPGASGFGFFHFKGRQNVQWPLGLIGDTKSLRGVHRAWSDGAVEWLNASEFDTTPATANTKASYRCSLAGLTFYYWY